MTKAQLVKLVHALAWRDDDLMNQDTLFELQDLIDRQLDEEARAGTLTVQRLSNGYAKTITLKTAP